MKTKMHLLWLSGAVFFCGKVHAEKQENFDPDRCLRQKVTAVFNVEFDPKNHDENLRRLVTRFRLGTSIKQIRETLQLIANLHSDCRLTDGVTLLRNGNTVTTFYITVDPSTGDTVWIYSFGFHFKNGKLVNIDDARLTMRRDES